MSFEQHIATLESANAELAAELTRLMADRDETDKDLIRVADGLRLIINDLRDIARNLNAGPGRVALANETAERLVALVRGD